MLRCKIRRQWWAALVVERGRMVRGGDGGFAGAAAWGARIAY